MHYGPIAWEEAARLWASGERRGALRLAWLLVRHAPRYLYDVTVEALAATKKRVSRSGRRLLRVR
jgi:hypothetical protein